MPGLSPIQPAFRGVVSPRMRGRVDLEVFKTALEECTNWRCTPQGSLLMRAGTEKVESIALPENERFIRFRMRNEQDFLLDFTNNQLKIFNIAGDAQPVDIGAVDLVVNGDFAAGSVGWAGGGTTAIFSGGACDLSNQKIARQGFYVATAGTYKLRVYWTYISAFGSAVVQVGTTLGGNQLLDTTVAGPFVGWSEFQIVVAAPGNVYLTFAGPNASCGMDNVSFTYLSGGGSYVVNTPWTSAQLEGVHYTVETGRDAMVFVHPNVRPYSLVRNADGTWTFAVVAFTAEPADWDPEWPETVEVSNSRVYYGIKNRVWGTRIGTISDLTLDANDPSAAIDKQIATVGSLCWLRGNRKLLAGTDLGEHMITGSVGPPMAGDFQALEQSFVGSAKVQAVNIGTEAVFVSLDRKDILALSYSRDNEGWEPDSLSFVAEHLLAGLVKEVHHVRTPEPLLVVLLRSGDLVAVDYDRMKKVLSWWVIDVGADVVTSAASTGPQGAFLWLAATRGTNRVMEKLPLSEIGSLRYLDSSVSVAVAGDGAVAGLGHLANGTTVRAVVDGVYLGEYVVASSAINVGAGHAGKTAVVGLGYRAKARTLPVEGGNPQGTSQGLAVHHSEIVARLSNSARPLLSVSTTPLAQRERATRGKPFDVGTDAVEALITADVRVANQEVVEGGQIDIEQDLPHRTEVCAIFSHGGVSRV